MTIYNPIANLLNDNPSGSSNKDLWKQTKAQCTESYQITPWNKGMVLGRVHSEEAKRKMAEARKGRRLSEEHKRAVSQSNKGKLLGRAFSAEHKHKLSIAHETRRPITEETRRKMSMAARARVR
jgi:hypothetical protein